MGGTVGGGGLCPKKIHLFAPHFRGAADVDFRTKYREGRRKQTKGQLRYENGRHRGRWRPVSKKNTLV